MERREEEIEWAGGGGWYIYMEGNLSPPKKLREVDISVVGDLTEYDCLLQQMREELEFKWSTLSEIIPSTKTMKGVINKVFYAGFSVRIIDTDKIIYIVRFPPTDGTVCPLLDKPSSKYDKSIDDISLEDATAFWSNDTARQVNGMWKGGSWGLDNLLPHSIWCTGAWIGDIVTIDFVKNGIIKFGIGLPGFPLDDDNGNGSSVLPHTMNSAWSVNITVDKTEKVYAGYAMNYIMPQYANDLLFIWKNPETGRRLVKICKRGDAPTVDMQNKLMPGAGEHLEPGEKFKFKASLTRAFREELGVADVALAKCFVLDLGKFNDPGRDPRYWTFQAEHGSFGMKRYSSTHGFVLYFEGDAPLLTTPADDVEVAQLGPSEKRWVDLESLDVSSDAWMIEDHVKIVRKAKLCVANFDMIPEEEKSQYLYKVEENNSENMMCYVYDDQGDDVDKNEA